MQKRSPWLQQLLQVTVLNLSQPPRVMLFRDDYRQSRVDHTTSSFGSPVMIVQVRNHSSVPGSFQPSHGPAKTNGRHPSSQSRMESSSHQWCA
jgi:hypothetical protein